MRPLLGSLLVAALACHGSYRSRPVLEPDSPFKVTFEVTELRAVNDIEVSWSIVNRSNRTKKGCLAPYWDYVFEGEGECKLERLILHLGCRPDSEFQLRPGMAYSWSESVGVSGTCGSLEQASFKIVDRSSKTIWGVSWINPFPTDGGLTAN